MKKNNTLQNQNALKAEQYYSLVYHYSNELDQGSTIPLTLARHKGQEIQNIFNKLPECLASDEAMANIIKKEALLLGRVKAGLISKKSFNKKSYLINKIYSHNKLSRKGTYFISLYIALNIGRISHKDNTLHIYDALDNDLEYDLLVESNEIISAKLVHNQYFNMDLAIITV